MVCNRLGMDLGSTIDISNLYDYYFTLYNHRRIVMKLLLSINKFALIICFLFYLTCYLRFIGQAFLCTVQIITALFITVEIFSKQLKFKKDIKLYWLVTIANATLLFSFFHSIMSNDFFQILFVSLIPNITAIYFFKLLIKTVDYENT